MSHHLTIQMDRNNRGLIQLDKKNIHCESLILSMDVAKMPTATITVPLSFIDIDIEKCDVVIEKPAEQITLADVDKKTK